jgi:hypothetical protein
MRLTIIQMQSYQGTECLPAKKSQKDANCCFICFIGHGDGDENDDDDDCALALCPCMLVEIRAHGPWGSGTKDVQRQVGLELKVLHTFLAQILALAAAGGTRTLLSLVVIACDPSH